MNPPMYWTSPDVLMVSLRCTEHPPMYSWYSSDVLNIPRCTHDIPPMYSRYPPDVLMVSLRCTEHLLMYSWYSSDVLNTPRCTHDIPPMYSWYPADVLNIPRCTEHTLYRVIFLDSFVERESRNISKMKVQCLLQKFTSCCIARDLRMLHIKMFISNAVQSCTNKQQWRICWTHLNKTTNKQPHFYAAFQMGTFREQPGLTAFHILLPLEKSSITFRFPVSP